MTTQLVFVILIVALAAAHVVRSTWKAWKKGATFCGGCPGTGEKTSSEKGVYFIPLKNVQWRRD